MSVPNESDLERVGILFSALGDDPPILQVVSRALEGAILETKKRGRSTMAPLASHSLTALKIASIP